MGDELQLTLVFREGRGLCQPLFPWYVEASINLDPLLINRLKTSLSWSWPGLPPIKDPQKILFKNHQFSQGPSGCPFAGSRSEAPGCIIVFSINQSKARREALGDHGTVSGILLICLK